MNSAQPPFYRVIPAYGNEIFGPRTRMGMEGQYTGRRESRIGGGGCRRLVRVWRAGIWIGCSGAGSSPTGMGPCSRGSSPGGTSRRSRRSSPATGRWSWASAGGCSADPHDADDAFQATFLVLVRKAGQLRDADRLGPWLYGVATRVATKARARDARRKSRTAGPVDVPSPAEDRSDWLDVRPILDAELGRLPAKFREILVLCLLEGSTAEEAARRLACPLGTVKSRLARGREALRSRLTVRGIAPAVAAAVAAGSARSAVASPVSQALSRATLGVVGLVAGPDTPGRRRPDERSRPEHAPHIESPDRRRPAGASPSPGSAWPPGRSSQAVAAQAAPRRPRPAAGRRRSNHMKTILLALHNYDARQRPLPARGDRRPGRHSRC